MFYLKMFPGRVVLGLCRGGCARGLCRNPGGCAEGCAEDLVPPVTGIPDVQKIVFFTMFLIDLCDAPEARAILNLVRIVVLFTSAAHLIVFRSYGID